MKNTLKLYNKIIQLDFKFFLLLTFDIEVKILRYIPGEIK